MIGGSGTDDIVRMARPRIRGFRSLQSCITTSAQAHFWDAGLTERKPEIAAVTSSGRDLP
jgi:hypothetical protein